MTDENRPPQGAGPGEVTQWLQQLRAGDRPALDRIVASLYGDLRAIARQRLRGEWGTRPMATTELVHEVYLRLIQQRRLAVEDRSQFFAVAANVMRRILVDAARARHSGKRGGGRHDLPLDEAEHLIGEAEAREMLLLDRALERLEALQPRAAEVVVHRYFAGLTLEESAGLLGVSAKTVQREWQAARAWLRKEMDRIEV
jgi:RNA polymerase sigma-70 factor, ECF subfamily